MKIKTRIVDKNNVIIEFDAICPEVQEAIDAFSYIEDGRCSCHISTLRI